VEHDRNTLMADRRKLQHDVEEYETKHARLKAQIDVINDQIRKARKDKEDADEIRSECERKKERLAREEVLQPVGTHACSL
jgi:prefoldin subunit 5